MKISSRHYLASFLLFTVLFISAPIAGWGQTEFTIIDSGGSVVARWSRTPAELAALDSSTLVTVYGDGRVVVSFPGHSPRKGSYQTRLSPAELDTLISSLVSTNALEFDPATLDEPLSKPPANRAARGVSDVNSMAATGAVAIADDAAIARVIRHTADADITRIEVKLAQYQPAGGASQRDVTKAVAVPGLQRLAQLHPDNEALSGLADAERKFVELIDSDTLVPLP